jgi:hypothetical protein
MRNVWATMLAVAMVLGLAAPAMAARPDGTRSTFTLTGFCTFDVAVDLTSWQQVRVVKTAPDGTTTTLITGRLTGTLTNADTGATLPINVSGPSKITEHPDGSVDIRVYGPTLVYLGAGVTGGEALFILNFGLFKLHIGDSISYQVVGRQVDVCPLLG